MTKKALNIGIITKSIGNAGVLPLKNLVSILNDLTNSLYIITGNRTLNILKKDFQSLNFLGFNDTKYGNKFLKILNNILVQISISINIILLIKKVNIWLFFLDSHALILPVLIAKILSKKVVFVMAASIKKSAESQYDPFAHFLIFSERITLKWSDKIVVYSPSLIKNWDLIKYENKIEICHRHVLNSQEFQIKIELSSRDNLVGYVGRLSPEKGIIPFLESIKKINLKAKNIKFLIIGDGPLKNEVENYIKENKLTNTFLLGWIAHDTIPSYLNKMKLLVLPSYSEGLPNVMIEAMGCGTPILVSEVGSIPDFIIDSKNGFIMKNNSSECITKNIIRSLEHPQLEKITINALNFAKKEFRKENIINKWKSILESFPDA